MNKFFICRKITFRVNFFVMNFFILIGLQSSFLDAYTSKAEFEDALFIMIQDNDVKKIKKLKTSEFNLDTKDCCGYTPLHWACFHNSIDVAKLFIQRGYDMTTKNNEGLSLLHTVAGNNFTELLELLIQKGVDIECRDNFGWTALHLAVCCHATEAVKVLIAAGADINSKDDTGATALLCIAVCMEPVKFVQLLIDAGVDVNNQNSCGITALSTAVASNKIEVAQALIDARANVNSFALLNSCKSDEMRNLLTANDSSKKSTEHFERYFNLHLSSSEKLIKKFIAYYAK